MPLNSAPASSTARRHRISAVMTAKAISRTAPASRTSRSSANSRWAVSRGICRRTMQPDATSRLPASGYKPAQLYHLIGDPVFGALLRNRLSFRATHHLFQHHMVDVMNADDIEDITQIGRQEVALRIGSAKDAAAGDGDADRAVLEQRQLTFG